jgi:hypothetical protein
LYLIVPSLREKKVQNNVWGMEYNITMETTIDNKTQILAQLWLDYKDDEEFTDFIEYNDLGLPLAYAVSTNIVKITPEAEKFINETFDLLLTGLGIEEDTGFEDLQELLELMAEEE